MKQRLHPLTFATLLVACKLIVNRYRQKEEYAADRHGADLLQRAG